jgi:hypothetical protein
MFDFIIKAKHPYKNHYYFFHQESQQKRTFGVRPRVRTKG